MSVLQIDQVSKLYQASTFGGDLTPALRGVSFGIGHGEVVTLIGESGSGKTTLGRIILRLASPSRGRVLFEESDIAGLRRAGLRDYYRHVQGVFQDPFSSCNPIYPADRVLELIRGVLGKYPHQLSGGQQQRLLIARALLLDVRLLVADEIISMLDASTRVDILNLLISLKRSGLAILFITHDLSLGHYVSDRTVILRRGAIVEMGDTVRVFGNPQHPYTRDLLAAVPELHRKWRPAAEKTQANGSGSVRADTPADAGRGRARSLTRAGRKPRPASALEPPPLTQFEEDHFVAAAEP